MSNKELLKDIKELLENIAYTNNPDYERPSWSEYFMKIAYLVSCRSTCLRRKVGAVAVSPDNRIIGTGYNGAIAGTEHCITAGCIRNELNIPSGERQEICRAEHAEANVCNYAARHGVSLDGATMYITTRPCTTCIKAMIVSGIKHVVYDGDYPDEFAMKIAKESGITLIKFNNRDK